jgi:phosphoglycerate dehydrogenase-like enzyme
LPRAAPRVAVGPEPAWRWVRGAIDAGGGVVADTPSVADALVWLRPDQPDMLAEVLQNAPEVRWVQLPFAGVEIVAGAGLLGDGRQWTSGKGAFPEIIAEHALALALAGLRRLPERARARSWGDSGGVSLFDQPVTIVGGGEITKALLALLAPFRVRATVVRRRPEPLDGAVRTVGPDELVAAIRGSRVTFLALALTSDTIGMIGADELAAIGPDGWLVSVSRGAHVDTSALIEALRENRIAGAALDVTDPEPLPDGHPLWDLPNCLITPHSAGTYAMVKPYLVRRVAENVRRFSAGEPLLGLVDPALGY